MAVSTARAGARQWAGMAVLLLPVLTVSIATTGLSFAVPALSAGLAPTATQLLWIVDIYPLVLAGLLVTMGAIGDNIGRRRLLIASTAAFCLLSALAAFAPTAGTLIAARAAMGVAGAGLLPSTMSLIQAIFRHPTDRRLAIALWSSAFAGGGALGPILGGWIIHHFWWGAIFLIPLVLMGAFLLAAPFVIPESRNPHPEKLDAASVALSIGAIAPLAYGIKQGAVLGVHPSSVLPLMLAAACAVIFVHRQTRLDAPLIDVSLFRNRIIGTAVTANFAMVFAYVGVQYYLVQHLQVVSGLPADRAGWWMLPGALASILMGVLVVHLAHYIPRWAIVTGGLLVTAAGAGMSLLLHVDTALVAPVLIYVILGAGSAMTQTISTDALLAAAPPHRTGAASGISETAFELGTALGITVLGSILTAAYQHAFTAPAGLTPEQAGAAHETLGAAAALAHSLPPELGTALLTSAQTAFVHAEQITGLITGIALLIVAAAVGHSYRRAGLDTTR